MRIIRLISLLLILVPFTSVAQTSTHKFGEVSNSDFNLDLSKSEEIADALVIYDIGKSYFIENHDTFDVVFERSTRLKILKESGLKWAEVEIPYYHEELINEKIHTLEIYVYNVENGRVKKSKITTYKSHEEVLNKYWNVKKYILPNVKAGSIIEYKYKIISQYTFNLRDWKFQWKIPVRYSKYSASMIPFYEYSWVLQGAKTFTSHKSYESDDVARSFGVEAYGNSNYRDLVEEFVMENVPAFNDEEFIASVNDYIIKLDFQLKATLDIKGVKKNISTTWERFIKDLSKKKTFGRYVKRSAKRASKLIDKKELSGKSEKYKFDYILSYVKENYRWNKYTGRYASKTVKSFINSKEGNCAEINLFTVGLLNAVGITSYPILISTRDHGKVWYDYPFRHYFNYVVIYAEVDGRKIMADATDPYVANDKLPSNCINGKGLLVRKGGVNLVNLACKTSSITDTKLSIDIREGESHIDIVKHYTEYDAIAYRTKYGSDKNLIKESLKDKGYSSITSTITLTNSEVYQKPYIVNYSVKVKTETEANKLYILPFAAEALAVNPLKQPSRRYSMDMLYPKIKTFKSSINIPEGYKVDRVPANVKIDNKFFSLNYIVEKNDKTVNVIFNYSFKYSTYSAKYYNKMKYYFSQLVMKGNEKIVLVKI